MNDMNSTTLAETIKSAMRAKLDGVSLEEITGDPMLRKALKSHVLAVLRNEMADIALPQGEGREAALAAVEAQLATAFNRQMLEANKTILGDTSVNEELRTQMKDAWHREALSGGMNAPTLSDHLARRMRDTYLYSGHYAEHPEDVPMSWRDYIADALFRGDISPHTDNISALEAEYKKHAPDGEGTLTAEITKAGYKAALLASGVVVNDSQAAANNHGRELGNGRKPVTGWFKALLPTIPRTSEVGK